MGAIILIVVIAFVGAWFFTLGKSKKSTARSFKDLDIERLNRGK